MDCSRYFTKFLVKGKGERKKRTRHQGLCVGGFAEFASQIFYDLYEMLSQMKQQVFPSGKVVVSTCAICPLV